MDEIERKFLVKGEFRKHISKSYKIAQGYLSKVPERTVRIRIRDDKGFLTIKGKSSKDGTTRFEFEKEISYLEATKLLKICEPGIIEKTRNIIIYENNKFEVDVFEGKNKGLIIAEIELKNKNDNFLKPEWLGEEVTGDKKYYNSNL